MGVYAEIESLFLEAVNSLCDIWVRAQKNDPYVGMSTNKRRALETLIQSVLNVKDTIFEHLVKKIHEVAPRVFEHRIDGVRNAVSAYLILAATRNYIEGELFREDDIVETCNLLIEDLSLEWYECRVYAILAGIHMNNQVVSIQGDTRLRRATKLEVWKMLQESKFDTQENVIIDLLYSTRDPTISVYVLESKISPEDPSNPRRIHVDLIDPMMDLLERLIMLFRVYFGTGVGTRLMKIGCWVDTSSSFSWRYPLYEVAPIDAMRSITMSGRSLSLYPSIFEVDSHATDRIRDVWSLYSSMSETASYFMTHHVRGTIRYAQSLNERYLEDKFIDLSICVETLMWTGGSLSADRVANLLGTENTRERIKEDISWLFEERNNVAHGGRLSVDEKPRNQQQGWNEVDDDCKNQLHRVEAIVRSTILATIYAAKAIDERTEGKKAFRLLLENQCDGSNGTLIRQNIPQWLFDEMEALYA